MRSVVLLLLSACAPPAVDTLVLSNPQALVECENIPDDLNARMWISGQSAPCALAVNVDDNTTSGSCDIVPGLVRRLTIDWFVPLDRDDGLDLVVAQTQGEIDLQRSDAADKTFTFEDADINTADCKDMRKDQFNGADTVAFGGADVPLCDLDASGAANVDEVCAGSDPLDSGVEP
jgi:hypothetical protein